MAVTGFNIGSTISLGDMGLAVDYLTDKDAFEPDLQEIKEKITNKEIPKGREKALTVKEHT